MSGDEHREERGGGGGRGEREGKGMRKIRISMAKFLLESKTTFFFSSFYYDNIPLTKTRAAVHVWINVDFAQ